MNPPSRMLTSIISSVAMPVLPTTGTLRCGKGGRYALSESASTCALATQSTSYALNTTTSEDRRYPRSLASSALLDTVAIATCWKYVRTNGSGSSWLPLAPRATSCAARTASSLQPPPPGNRPTPASTRPVYDSSAATVRSQCMMNSQDPPSAMPRTAATVGIRLYFRRCEVCWNLATTASTASHCPSCTADEKEARLAPKENGSRVCQMTRPRQFFSASAIAASMPSSTSSPMVLDLVLKETIAMSSPVCHMRTASVSWIVVPFGHFSPRIGSGKYCRL